MRIDINIGELILYAVTAVGIIEWSKHIVSCKSGRTYALILPLVAAGIGLATLVPPVLTALQIWAVAQLAYPVLVQLPAKVIEKG